MGKEAEKGFEEFGTTCSHQAINAQHLPCSNVQIDVGQDVLVGMDGILETDIPRFEHNVTIFVGLLDEEILLVSSNHHAYNLVD